MSRRVAPRAEPSGGDRVEVAERESALNDTTGEAWSRKSRPGPETGAAGSGRQSTPRGKGIANSILQRLVHRKQNLMFVGTGPARAVQSRSKAGANRSQGCKVPATLLAGKGSGVAFFAVCYQLRYQSELTRRRFCDEVERLGGVEALDRFYFLDLDGTAIEVRDHLRTFLTERDLLTVVEFEKLPEVTAALAGAATWIEDRFVVLRSL
jgi:hypothetical protein